LDLVEKLFQLVRSKTVEFYILNSRGLLLGSPEGYPTIDFLHIQPQTTTFNHTPHNRVLSNCSTKLCWACPALRLRGHWA